VNLIADRFVAVSEKHAVDLATGERVLIVCSTSGGITEERRWALRCEWLFEMRHRSIAELVDYGGLSETKRFEAWRCADPWSGSARALQSAIDAAGSFLRSSARTHAAQTDRVMTSYDGRALVVPGPGSGHAAGEPESCCGLEDCGLALIPRDVVSRLAEIFSESRPGLRALALCDVPGAGVSTVVRGLSRVARLAGFVPFALATNDRTGGLLAGRSLFAIADAGNIEDSWREFLNLTIDTPKPHLLLFAGHQVVPRVQTIHLQRFPPERLAQAVRPGVQQSRERRRIESAACRARGLPGRFVELLWQLPPRTRVAVRKIHGAIAAESPASYAGQTEPEQEPSTAVDGPGWADPNEVAALRRRLEAAVKQLGAGRLAPGERALRAAVAGLVRRHEWPAAARGSVALATAVLQRGRARDAQHVLKDAKDYARRAADDNAVADVAILSGIAWTDQGRLDEAESLLSASLAAATSRRDMARTVSSRLALARCHFWRAQYDQSSEVLLRLQEDEIGPGDAVARLIGLSRAAIGGRDFEAAMRHAMAASDIAERSGQPALAARATCGLAFAHLAVGDSGAVTRDVTASVRAARPSRDSLCAVRARLIGAENDRRSGRTAAAHALASRITRIPAGHIPATVRVRGLLLRDLLSAGPGIDVVRRQVAASGLPALVLFGPPVADERGDIRAVVDDVVDILQASQQGDDDKAVLMRICVMLRTRLQASTIAFFAADGGSFVPLVWDGNSRLDPEIANRVGATRQTIAPHTHHDLIEAGAPVRYGGETIGVCVARWTLGSAPDVTRPSLLLTTAATAVGPALACAIARRTAPPLHDPVELLGVSPAMTDVRRAIERAAAAPFPVLIEGESGSGKELVAKALHRRSTRRDRPFCALNCAALPDDLVEAELFGHARGAFTGAVSERAGVFEEAHTGTLFLDEIGELSPRAQAKVLRTVQEGELRRVGENVSRRVDVRIVSATNRDLNQEVTRGRFRLDLLYRLDVVRITLPPLRDRREDVALLVERYWREAADRVGSRAILGAATLAALARYDWPGNVRELQNVLAALAVRCSRRGVVGPDALPPAFGTPPPASAFRLDEARRTFEERFVRAALVRSGGHRGRTAIELGVTRQGLAKLMVRLGIVPSPMET
jgi:DNA-binding NtrC family response regulator/tetratricopeptide (TPR) repeat protein